MKIAIFSDSHGIIRKMLDVCRTISPDLIIHLGDFTRDTMWLRESFPDTPLKAVHGNCDFAAVEREADTFFADGLKIFLCHGHRYNVKRGLSELAEAAALMGADIALFGHTHQSHVSEISGVTLINPGSAGDDRRPTCTTLDTVSREVRIIDLDT